MIAFLIIVTIVNISLVVAAIMIVRHGKKMKKEIKKCGYCWMD